MMTGGMKPISGNLTLDRMEELKAIVGAGNWLTEEESLRGYSHDETEELSYLPEIVLKPRTAGEVRRYPAFVQ